MNSEEVLKNKILPHPDSPKVVVLGLESVGKSTIISAFLGRKDSFPSPNEPTLKCEEYSDNPWNWIDTPGLIVDSDASTAKDTLKILDSASSVLLVLRAHKSLQELNLILPFIGSCKVSIALTFKDHLGHLDKALQKNLLEQWRNRLGIPVTLLESRNPDATELANLRLAILRAQPLLIDSTVGLKLFPEESSNGKLKTLEKLASFSPISFLLLFFPAWIAVNQANKLADQLYDPLYFLLDPFLHWLNQLPKPLALTLAGDYGVFAMFPFLVLYALPTILMFTALIAIYKSTGLIDRISYGLHTWLVPFGLGGRDLVRVIMGFGCNVPAVVASRSCSSCSRGACVSAISFGSACSYQLPATLAVFSAAGFVWLGSVYLLVLATTTLIYLRITSPRSVKSYKNTIQTQSLIPLQFPNWKTVFGESVQSLRDFIGLALPVFVFICIFAGSLQLLGILNWMSGFLAPVMALFNLPPESALSVVLGSVRKDGLAVGLLDSNWNALKAPLDTPVQVLTAVYLAGVLLPCLVTVLTVVKEMKIHFAIKMVLRQAGFAILFSLSIAWGGSLFYME